MRRLIVLLVLLFAGTAQAAPAPRVLVSIKPLHAIVAAVMGDAGAPELLLTGAASPHSYALKPSDARKLAGASIVFWAGPELETFLETPIRNLAPRARVVALAQAQGVTRLAARRGGLWEADPDEGRGGIDGHVWLDPLNAMAMARAAARTLSEADPARAGRYAANAEAFAARVARLDGALKQRLEPVRNRPYIVFHDAFHYFEAHYGLASVGAVTVASERPPGTRRIEELRARIKAARALCVLTTPQFPPRIVNALTEGTSARTAALDDMGADIPAGPGLYDVLLTRIAGALTACLAP
jgi:zinc transport system substrate-binding protein